MGVTGGLAAVTMGASAFSAYGKLKAGQSAQKMYDTNAGYADWQAADALERGATNEKRTRQNTEAVIGSQRVSLATQGVDVNKGSSLDVQADAAYLGELDALTVRNNAAKEAYGYTVEAADLRERGKIVKQTSQMEAINTIVGGGSSLLLAKYGGGPYSQFGVAQNATAPRVAAAGRTGG